MPNPPATYSGWHHHHGRPIYEPNIEGSRVPNATNATGVSDFQAEYLSLTEHRVRSPRQRLQRRERYPEMPSLSAPAVSLARLSWGTKTMHVDRASDCSTTCLRMLQAVNHFLRFMLPCTLYKEPMKLVSIQWCIIHIHIIEIQISSYPMNLWSNKIILKIQTMHL